MAINIGNDISVGSAGFDTLVLSTTDACDNIGVKFPREAHLLLSTKEAIELATALLVTVAAVNLADSKVQFPDAMTPQAAADESRAA